MLTTLLHFLLASLPLSLYLSARLSLSSPLFTTVPFMWYSSKLWNFLWKSRIDKKIEKLIGNQNIYIKLIKVLRVKHGDKGFSAALKNVQSGINSVIILHPNIFLFEILVLCNLQCFADYYLNILICSTQIFIRTLISFVKFNKMYQKQKFSSDRTKIPCRIKVARLNSSKRIIDHPYLERVSFSW